MSLECGRLRLIMQNQIEKAALSASPPVSVGLPVDNLKSAWRSRVTRSDPAVCLPDVDGVLTQVVNGTLVTGEVADGFAIIRHNLNGADTCRLELFDAENQTGERVYDSGDQPVAALIPMGTWVAGVNFYGETYSKDLDTIWSLWFTPVAYRSWKLTLTSYDNLTGYIQVGMLYLGKSISPEYNFSWGAQLLWDDGHKLTRTEGGSLMTEGGNARRREIALSLDSMSDLDRNLMGQAVRNAYGYPVLIAAYPVSTNVLRRTEYTMVAKIQGASPFTHTAHGEHRHAMRFLEV